MVNPVEICGCGGGTAKDVDPILVETLAALASVVVGDTALAKFAPGGPETVHGFDVEFALGGGGTAER